MITPASLCCRRTFPLKELKKSLRPASKLLEANVIEAINYKETIQVPQTDEGFQAQYYVHEIEPQSQTGMSAEGLTGGARWGNPRVCAN